MIAVDVKMFSINSVTALTVNDKIMLANTDYENVMNFFQECVDQSIILNLVQYEESVDHDVTTYFAPSMEKAQMFEQKFQNLTADFSMKKLWNQVGLDISISLREIDFDEEMMSQMTSELVNIEHSQIWGFPYPALT